MTDLLQHSDAFHERLDDLLGSASALQTNLPRHLAAAASALLSLEHASAARQCFANDLPHSATALLRLQFEAVVRGAWSLHAAGDDAIALLDGPLSEGSDEQARKLPGATLMLKALVEKAPAGLVEPLRQFHSVAWHGLNSYVHAGIHPLQRRARGYPAELAAQQVRSSNGLLHLAYRLLASLTGSATAMHQITHAWHEFEACLPITPAR
jgi:hypothetical protein